MTNQVLLHEKFAAVSRAYPTQRAVVEPDGELTYSELDAKATVLAGKIAPFMGRAGRVLICLEPGIDFVTAILAVLKAGGTYVPLHHGDPSGRIAAMFSLPGADLLITDQEKKSVLAREIPLRVFSVEELLGMDLSSSLPGRSTSPENHAYIIHTSGSTGTPKAMGISHAAVLNLLTAFDQLCPLDVNDSGCLWSALHFDVSVYEIWSVLISGATLFIPEERIRFSPEAFLEWVTEKRITTAYIPPFMIETMAEAPANFKLRRMLTGVEPIPEPLLCQIKRAVPGLTLINGYGPAEATICATLYPVPDTPSRQGRSPIGKPVPNVSIELIDEQGHPVQTGSKGEMIISGIQVSDGYINVPGKNAEVFESRKGGPSYRTGDIGIRLKDGNLVFLGRKDFQLKVKGVRIEPGEIEGLIRKYKGVTQAALVLKKLNSGHQGLVAYVTHQKASVLNNDDLLGYLKQMLPRTMIPAAIICLDHLPVTPHGKIDRQMLSKRKDPELAISPQTDSRPPIASHISRRDAEKIARIWEAILNIPVGSGNENFLLLGGDSIAAAAIMARINKVFNMDLPLTLLFEFPEFHRFSAAVSEQMARPTARTIRETTAAVSTITEMPLLPDQKHIWLFESLYPKSAVYHIPLVFDITGDLDAACLEKALRHAVEAHPALGMVFTMEGDKLCQKWRSPNIPFSRQKLRQKDLKLFHRLDDPDIRKWLEKEIHRPFNLEKGPLIRAALLQVEPIRHILCMTVHHLVFDGWSAGLFIESLNKAYKHLLASSGPGPQKRQGLASKASNQANTVRAYQDHIRHKLSILDRQWPRAKSFFKRYLENLPEIQSSSQEASFTAWSYPLSLDKTTYGNVKSTARLCKTTPFTVLLAIFQLSLALRTDQKDQVTGIAYAGRDRLASESVCGCFMNTLIIRSKIPFNTSFTRFLEQIKKTLETIFQHKDIPFHSIQEYLQQQGSKEAIVNTLFLMQNVPLGPLLLSEDLQTRHHPQTAGHANIGLTLELYEHADGAEGWMKYQTGQYTEKEVQRLARTFKLLTKLVLDHPDESLKTLTQETTEMVGSRNILAQKRESILSAPSFPLSPMQHGMLMESLRAPQGAGCYVEQVVFDMEEEIDIKRFTAAWENVTQHHDFLRLGFEWKGKDHPEQFITPPAPVRIEYNDWSSYHPAEIKEYLDMFLKADRRLGFNLNQPPVFRVVLFKTGQERYTSVWSFHHSIGDGRSMVFVLRHLFRAYRNPDLALPSQPSFRQYIAWLYSRQTGNARQFWRQYLSEFTEPMVFPFRINAPTEKKGHRQPHAMALTTGHHDQVLSPVTCRTLMILCREHGLSVNAFLMGAWAILLSHYTGKTDIVFGATVSTRHFDPAHREGTGLYINTLPVRIKVTPDQFLIPYISDIRDQWKKIRHHDHLSLTEIHSLSPIQGNSPLSEIFFSYDYTTLEEAMATYKKEMSCSRIQLLERTPAAIFLTATGTDRLKLSIEYDRRKFSAKTTSQILDHFSFFLKSCVQSPESRLKDLPVLTKRETELIQKRLNTLQGHLPPTSCFHQLFEIQSGINSDAPAVTDGQVHYTYGDLNRLANQLAHFLISEGIGPGKKIMILMDQTADMIAVIIGILKTGACYVPLDTATPKDRIHFIVADCHPDFIITDSNHTQKVDAVSVRRLILDQEKDRILKQATANPDLKVLPESLAYIIYTSGSTGHPKGVMIAHKSLSEFAKTAAQTYEIEPSDKVLQFASISFDASVEEIFPTLHAGASLVVKPRDVLQTPQAFFSYCREMALSVIDLPTAYWHMIVDEIKDLALPPTLRLVIIGGDSAHPERVRAWQKSVGNTVRLLNTYGPTETTVAVTWEDLSASPLELDIVPIGVPFASVNLNILNHFEQASPPGVTGELFIGGPQVATGYLNLEKETQQAFQTINTNGSTNRWFKTGDLVKMLPSGQVLFIGRRDRQIKIRGNRVEPGEIEAALVDSQMVSQCALVLTQTQDQDVRMAAFFVPSQETVPHEEHLKDWLKSKLPDYMIPSLFIPIKALPYTASGKVDYTVLKKSLKSTKPQPPDQRDDSLPECAIHESQISDPYQIGLCDIWETILDTECVGPEDNFFEVGGSSLTAIRLVSAIEKRFRISLPVLAIFKFPRLKDLAEQLRINDSRNEFSSVTPIQVKGDRSPIFFVAGTEENTENYKDAELRNHPFYTVTILAHKTEGGEIIPMDVWEIARQNLKEILLADANGPYIIIGFCRYCLIAYEIASQLTSMGKQVQTLIFIDEFWQEKNIASFVSHHISGISRFGIRSLLKKIIPKTREKIHMFSLKLDRLKEKYYKGIGEAVPEHTQYRLMEAAFWKAYNTYIPMPYHGDAIVMDTINWREKYAPKLSKSIKGQIKRIEVKATHRDWFKPAQIDAVIQAIEESQS